MRLRLYSAQMGLGFGLSLATDKLKKLNSKTIEIVTTMYIATIAIWLQSYTTPRL